MVADLWPPFADSRLTGNGLAAELVSTALKRAGHTTEYIEVPAARIMLGLEHQQYDLIVGAWPSQEREGVGQFSKPYLTNRVVFLQRTDTSFRHTTLADVQSRSIAVVRGYRYSPEFDSDAKLQKVNVKSFQMAARMLAAGRVDLALEDELVARYFLGSELLPIRDKLKFVPNPLIENDLHILVRRSHPLHEQIIDDFNREMGGMCEDGTYGRIFRRHGFEPPVMMGGESCP